MVDTADLGTCMSAERKTADGVPAAQARAMLFSRSTLIRIVARFGLLGVLVMICTPNSLSQVGLALGAQAGERRLREVLSKGRFTRVRRAAETPFNMILEARP
jgi:hypothetical protein